MWADGPIAARERKETEGVLAPVADGMEGDDAADGRGHRDPHGGLAAGSQVGQGQRPGQGMGQGDDRIRPTGSPPGRRRRGGRRDRVGHRPVRGPASRCVPTAPWATGMVT